MVTLMPTEMDRQLVDYLEKVTKVRGKAVRETHEDWEYSCYEEFVLVEGGRFEVYGSPLRPKPQKFCFENCRRLVMRSKRYSYCEGWATSIIPMHHAWLIDQAGAVVDPTWGHRTGTAYYGVAFTREEVEDQFEQVEEFSMLYGWGSDHRLLRHGRIDAPSDS